MSNEITKADAALSNFHVQDGYIATLSLESDEDKLKVAAAYNAATSLASLPENTVLNVCDVFTMPGVRKSRTPGAPDTECMNTYLITIDGEAFFTQSDGIYRSVQMYAALYPDFGKSRAEGCLPLKVVSRTTANGNTIKSLVTA